MSISHDIDRGGLFAEVNWLNEGGSSENLSDTAGPRTLTGDVTGSLNNEPEDERRADRRVISSFRPGCVLAEGRMLLGLIRNLSAGGAMMELDESIEPGTRVRYFWDETNPIDAVVVWSEGRAHGFENAEAARPFENPFPYRSVRVPCAMRAVIYANGVRYESALENLSLGGMRVSGFRAPRGALITVRLGEVELPNASVRWCRGDETGVRFERPLTRPQFARVLSGMAEEPEVPDHDAS